MEELHKTFEDFDPRNEESLKEALELIRKVPEPWLRLWIEAEGPGVPPGQAALVKTELARRDQLATEKLTMRVTVWAASAGILGALLGGVCGAFLTYLLSR